MHITARISAAAAVAALSIGALTACGGSGADDLLAGGANAGASASGAEAAAGAGATATGAEGTAGAASSAAESSGAASTGEPQPASNETASATAAAEGVTANATAGASGEAVNASAAAGDETASNAAAAAAGVDGSAAAGGQTQPSGSIAQDCATMEATLVAYAADLTALQESMMTDPNALDGMWQLMDDIFVDMHDSIGDGEVKTAMAEMLSAYHEVGPDYFSMGDPGTAASPALDRLNAAGERLDELCPDFGSEFNF